MSDLCLAVKERRLISVRYGGGWRTIEPRVHGFHRRTGNEVIRAFQVSGYSSSSPPDGWRSFRLDEMSEITVLSETFPADRSGYNPNDPDMSQIHCRVDQLHPR